MDIEISEPSGITLDIDGSHLYCVSDPPDNRVYRLDMEGGLLGMLNFQGEDLEGISFDPRDNSVWVVDEERSEIVHLSLSGNELSRTRLDHLIPDNSSGLEGIVLRPGQQDIFVVKQKDPPAIIYVDSTLATSAYKKLDFTSDITGICEGRGVDELILISSGEKRLYEWSWEMGVLASYRFGVKQAEGVVYDSTSSTLYIVCDDESRLYTYQFPD